MATMSDLEAELRKCLPEFSDDKMEKLLEYLLDQGVNQLRDLEFLNEQDLLDSGILKKAHSGRLFRSRSNAVKEPALPKPVEKVKESVSPKTEERTNCHAQEHRNMSSLEEEQSQEEDCQRMYRNMYERAMKIKSKREARSRSPSTAWANLDRKGREEYQRKLHREMKESYEQSVRDIWTKTDQSQAQSWSTCTSRLSTDKEEFVKTVKSHLPNADIKTGAVPTAGALAAGFIGYCVTGSIVGAVGAGAGLIVGGLVVTGIALGARQVFASESDQCNKETDSTENITSEQA